MTLTNTAPFALSDALAAKSNPDLIDVDRRHFTAIQESLDSTIADLQDRMDTGAPPPPYPSSAPRTPTRWA